MEQGRIVIVDSVEFNEFMQDLPLLKGSNGKSLCIECWCIMSTYQRDNIHQNHFPNHVIKKPKEWTEKEFFLNFAKSQGHLTQNKLRLPYLSSGKSITSSSMAKASASEQVQ